MNKRIDANALMIARASGPAGTVVQIHPNFRFDYECHYCGSTPSKYFIFLADIVTPRRVIACCDKCISMHNRMPIIRGLYN